MRIEKADLYSLYIYLCIHEYRLQCDDKILNRNLAHFIFVLVTHFLIHWTILNSLFFVQLKDKNYLFAQFFDGFWI